MQLNEFETRNQCRKAGTISGLECTWEEALGSISNTGREGRGRKRRGEEKNSVVSAGGEKHLHGFGHTNISKIRQKH